MKLTATTFDSAKDLAESLLQAPLCPDKTTTSKCGYKVMRAANGAGLVRFFADCVEVDFKSGEEITIHVLEAVENESR